MGLVDWVFPLKCVGCGNWGVWLCEECRGGLVKAEQKCPMCEKRSVNGWTHERCKKKLGLDGVWMEFEYEAKMQRLIKAIKYRFCKELVGEVMSEWGGGKPFGEINMMVPIPLHRLRENWRGFNQAVEVAGVLVKKWKVSTESALERRRATKPIAEMGSSEARKKEMAGVFGLKDGMKIKGKRIVLVDDVFTSGTTMREATKVLKRAGARWVGGWVLAG